MARLRFLDVPPQANEDTEFRVTTKRGEEAPRLAVKVEKRAIKSKKLNDALFVV